MSAITNLSELVSSVFLHFKTSLLLAALTFLLLNYLWSERRRSAKLPPGPWGLPLVGYLPFLSANEPHIQLEELRKKYGNVFGLYLGSKYALYLGDLERSKEAYNVDEFSGRPEGALPISEKCTHFAALSGQPWKDRRKWAIQALRQLGIATQMIQNSCREQMDLALDRLESELASSPTGDVNVRDILTHTTVSVVLKFVCGKAFPPEHQSYKTVSQFLRFFAEQGASSTSDVLIPWTKPITKVISQYSKKSSKSFSDMEKFMKEEVENHMCNRPEVPKDLIDFLIKQHGAQGVSKSRGNEVYKIPVDDINGDAQVMIFAGADTVRATVEWYLLCMAAHPEIQDKVFQEIDHVLGPTGEVRYEDRAQLPFTEASVLESMRYKTLAPVNVYHSATREKEFCGYTVPKDALVFALLWTVHTDPAYWSHPHEFHPEHFLKPNGSEVQIPEAFQPFAPGKRTCAGDKAALIECYLFGLSLVRRFKILPPDGGLNMNGHLRVNMEAFHPVVKLMKRYH